MSEMPPSDDTMMSLKYIQASSYPLMRRLDQHLLIESRWNECEAEMSRLGNLNRSLLASIEDQESRLKKLQAQLHSPPTMQSEIDAASKRDKKTCKFAKGDSDDIVVSCKEFLSAENNLDSDDRLAKKRGASSSEQKQFIDSDQPNEPDSTKSTENPNFISPSQQLPIKISSIPEAPKNVIVTDIRHDSYTIEWEISTAEGSIFDYEISYTYFSPEEVDTLVRYSCARWCLKHPIPKGKFTVPDLEPNTKYRNISIRRRNKIGWSEYSIPIESICTAEKGKPSKDFSHQ